MFTWSAKGFNVRAQTVIGTFVWSSTDELQWAGRNHCKLARRGTMCSLMLWKAQHVDFLLIPALALGSCKAISHRQTAPSLQNRRLNRWRTQQGDRCTCTKRGKNTPEGKEGSSVCLPPETCMSLETKPSQELLFHAAVWSASFPFQPLFLKPDTNCWNTSLA